MKKIVAIFLFIALLFVFAACGEEENSSVNNDSRSNAPVSESANFENPKNYASVLILTINPQFKLYLDNDGKVLDVEAVNEDAQTIIKTISYTNESFEKVVETIISKAHEKGFIAEDTTIDFEITENKSLDADANDILNKAVASAKQAAETLDIKINVNFKNSVSESEKAEQDNNISSGDNDAENNNSSGSNKKPQNNTSVQQTTHSHKFSAATCTVPKKCSCGATQGSALGHNYEKGFCKRCGAKNPDGVNAPVQQPTHSHQFSAANCTEPKKCSCGVTEGPALGHNYEKDTCKRCGANDPNYVYTTISNKNGIWTTFYVNKNRLYEITFMLYGSTDELGVFMGYCNPFSTIREQLQEEGESEESIEEWLNEIRADEEGYVVFDGEEYYVGSGNFDSINSVSEEGRLVTLTDSSGSVLTLTRSSENTLKVTSSPDEFANIEKFPVGIELVFKGQ